MGRLPLKCLFPLSLAPVLQRDASPGGNATVYIFLTSFYFFNTALPGPSLTHTTPQQQQQPLLTTSAAGINNHIHRSTPPAVHFDQAPTDSRMAHMQWPVGGDAISFGDAITLNLLYPCRRKPPAVEPSESASLCSADPGAAAVLRWIPPDEMEGWTWEDGAKEIDAYDWGWQVGDPPREEEVVKEKNIREKVKDDGEKAGEGEAEREMQGVEFAHASDRVAGNASSQLRTVDPVQAEEGDVEHEEYSECMQAVKDPEERIQQQDGNNSHDVPPALSLLIPTPMVEAPDSTISPIELSHGNTWNRLETVGEHGAEEGSQVTREILPSSSAGPAVLPSHEGTQQQGSEIVEASPRLERDRNAEVTQCEGELRLSECNEGRAEGSIPCEEERKSNMDDCHEGEGDESEHFASDDWEAEPLQSKTINGEQVDNLAGQFTTSLSITHGTALSHHIPTANHTKSFPVEEKDNQQTEIEVPSTTTLPPISPSSSAVVHTVGSTPALSPQFTAPVRVPNEHENPDYPNTSMYPTIEAQYGEGNNNYPNHSIPLGPAAIPQAASLLKDCQRLDDDDDDDDDANFHGVDPDYDDIHEDSKSATTVPRAGEGDGVSSHSEADPAGADHVDTMQQPLLSGLEEAAAEALLQLGSSHSNHAGGVRDYEIVERDVLPDIRDILSTSPHERSDNSTKAGMSTPKDLGFGLGNASIFNSCEVSQDNRRGPEGTLRPGGGHQITGTPYSPYAVMAKQQLHPAPATPIPVIENAHAKSSPSRYVACTECRRRKEKCVRDPYQLDVACERCRQSNKACIPHTAWAISSNASSSLSTRSKSEGPRSGSLTPLPAGADLRDTFSTHETFDQKASQRTGKPFLSLDPMGADVAQAYQHPVTYVPVQRRESPAHLLFTPNSDSVDTGVNLEKLQNPTSIQGRTLLTALLETSDSVNAMPEESAIQDMLASNISSPSEETAAAPPSTSVKSQPISLSEQHTRHGAKRNPPSTQLLPKNELENQHEPASADKDTRSPFLSTPTPTQFFQAKTDTPLQQSKIEIDKKGQDHSVGATGGAKWDKLTDVMSDLSDVPPTLENPTNIPVMDSHREEEVRTLGSPLGEEEKKDAHATPGADTAQQPSTQDNATQIAPTLKPTPKPKPAGPKPRSKLPLKRNRSLSTRVKNPSSSKRKDKDYKPGSSGDDNDEPAKKKQKKRRSSATGGVKRKGKVLTRTGRGLLDRPDEQESGDVRMGAEEEEARGGGAEYEEEQMEDADDCQNEGAKVDNNKPGKLDNDLANEKNSMISLGTTSPALMSSAAQGEQFSRSRGLFPNVDAKARPTYPGSVRRESLRRSTLAQAPDVRPSALVPKSVTPTGALALENAEADGKANVTHRIRSLTPTDLQPRYGKRTTRADTLREKQAGSDDAATVAMQSLDTATKRKEKAATQTESGTGRRKGAGDAKRKVEEEVSTSTDMKSPPRKRASRRVSEKVGKEKGKVQTGVSTRKRA